MPSGKNILDGGHVLFTHLEDNIYAGVGILLHAEHACKSNRIHCISGRVLALDFMVGLSKVRAVAVYAPHRGYDWKHFEETFEQLRCVLDQAQKLKRKLIIGGDFNLQLGVGVRGEEFQNVVDGFGLATTNESDTPWENQ